MLGAFTGDHVHALAETQPVDFFDCQVIGMFSEEFTADAARKDFNLRDTLVVHIEKIVQVRIIACHCHLVVKISLQAFFQAIEISEVDDPVSVIQRCFEFEAERKRVTVQARAMRMRRAPLTETCGQAEVMAEGFG